MGEIILLIIFVPVLAFIGVGFLATAFLVIYRDVLGIDDKVSRWLDKRVGIGLGRGPKKDRYLSTRLVYLGFAVVMAFTGYACLRYGVVEPIAKVVFGI